MSGEEALPSSWIGMFDGEALDQRLGVSALLCTTSDDGWPHASFLGVGEILMQGPDRLGLMLWPHSNTARNLTRTGRASLFAAADGEVWEARLQAAAIGEVGEEPQIFHATVAAVRRHPAPYAEVEGMITFRLHDPAGVLDRWREQIARLRASL
jgi:hypothetical protein